MDNLFIPVDNFTSLNTKGRKAIKEGKGERFVYPPEGLLKQK
jgi:hypothetical protein